MIVAAGLTPAWQQILRFDGFRLGEVNRAIDAHWCSSGKVLNVGMALACLGAEFATVALLGGPARALIEGEFAALDIHRHWVEAHHPTRTCTTILDTKTNITTELVENAGPVSASELEQFAAAYSIAVSRARIAVLTGSLPPGAPPDFYRELLRRTPCRAILDIRGDELRASLACRPFLVKPNREELGRTFGRELTSDALLWEAMRQLNDEGAEWVLITDGPRPAWASREGAIYCVQPPQVEVVNPIGSGDCLAAGIAWGLSLDSSVLDAIRLGMAAAAENVTQLLPSRIDPRRVRDRAASIVLEQV